MTDAALYRVLAEELAYEKGKGLAATQLVDELQQKLSLLEGMCNASRQQIADLEEMVISTSNAYAEAEEARLLAMKNYERETAVLGLALDEAK